MHTLKDDKTLQAGKYKIEKVLGQGGFGITYLAEQVMLGRKVAVKEFFMKDLCNRDCETSQVSVGSTGSLELVERFKEKFLKEARLIAGMEHNHIVRIHDIFEENGTAYYIMENIDGGSVDGSLNKGIAIEEAIRIIKEVGSALEYIHKQNILHLDIKPSNILLRKNGEAVLIDFGISKRYDNEGGQTSTTPVGISKGYAPIEQYNQGLQNFSPATDIYSLGATLFKLLTGQTPPEAPVLLDDEDFPNCPSNVPEYIWKAIEKAMEPRRKYRYQTVDEFLNALSNNSVLTTPTDKKDESTQIISQKIKEESNKDADETVVIVENNNYNGKPFVDLGLSVKWAKFNFGASSEYDRGELCPFSAGSSEKLPSNISGNRDYDICRKVMQGDWRLPTKQEQDELRQKCNWEYLPNKLSYKVTGPNGNSIILPNTHTKNSTSPQIGCYWSASLHPTNNKTAFYINFDHSVNTINWMNDSLDKEFAIRAVIG